jgi:spore maturation protein CgeB
VFARFQVTVHVPRRPYVAALPGIPTIRVFEALACGIPLICSPWDDAEELFTPGSDYLIARDSNEMRQHLELLVSDPGAGRALAERGRETILARHTCAHRVEELLDIVAQLDRDEPLCSGQVPRRIGGVDAEGSLEQAHTTVET